MEETKHVMFALEDKDADPDGTRAYRSTSRGCPWLFATKQEAVESVQDDTRVVKVRVTVEWPE